MKKLLYISPQNVIPPIDGGKQGIYYPIKYLSKYFKVYFAFLDKNPSSKLIKDYKKLGVIPVPLEKDTQDNPILLFKNIFSKYPFKIEKYIDKYILEKLDRLIKKENIKIVLSSHIHTAFYPVNLKKLNPDIKIFLREHNIEWELVYQFYKLTKNPVFKLISYWQYKKTKRFEIEHWKYFDKVIFISDSDFDTAKKYLDKNKAEIVYDGFEIKSVKREKIEKNSFIFSGSLKTYQNRENLKWFIENIWKHFVSKNKEYKLYITGNSQEILEKNLGITTEEMKRLNIINLGFVDNLDKVLSEKEFFVSPTIFGSGIRIKILHALSIGIPVLATPLDCNMVKHFKDLENIVCFKNVEDFKEKVRILKENKNLYEKISKNAFNLVKDKLNWKNYATKIKEIIEK